MFYKFLKGFLEESKKAWNKIRTTPNAYDLKASKSTNSFRFICSYNSSVSFVNRSLIDMLFLGYAFPIGNVSADSKRKAMENIVVRIFIFRRFVPNIIIMIDKKTNQSQPQASL